MTSPADIAVTVMAWTLIAIAIGWLGYKALMWLADKAIGGIDRLTQYERDL